MRNIRRQRRFQLIPLSCFRFIASIVTQAITLNKNVLVPVIKARSAIMWGTFEVQKVMFSLNGSSKLQYAFLGSCISGGNIIKRDLNNIVNTFVN